MKKLDNMLTAAEEIKLSVSKHEFSIRDVNKKFDTVFKQPRFLSSLTLPLKNRADSIADETIKNEVLRDRLVLEV